MRKVDREHTDSATPECRQYHTHDRLLITALPFVNVTAVQIITILNTVWVQVYGSNHITLSILFKSFVNTPIIPAIFRSPALDTLRRVKRAERRIRMRM